jgi:hypothetical protein
MAYPESRRAAITKEKKLQNLLPKLPSFPFGISNYFTADLLTLSHDASPPCSMPAQAPAFHRFGFTAGSRPIIKLMVSALTGATKRYPSATS